MAIDVKSIMADALLALCEKKPLNKITIANIRQQSGVSHQTFYNHFKDKQDLIQYIYETRVITMWSSPSDLNLNYYDAKLAIMKSELKYHSFIKQACMMTGANCLSDFMYAHSKAFDRAWLQNYYGKEPLPPDLCFASDYHSAATMHLHIQWIIADMPTPPEELLENFIRMRMFSLNELIFDKHDEMSPFAAAAKKASECGTQRKGK